MSVTASEAIQKFAYWRSREKEYREKSERDGSLRRSEWWDYEYCQTPYLTLASDEYVAKRWIDQFHNNVRLTGKGQIAPREDFADDAGLFGPLFSHLVMEYGIRGGVPVNVIETGRSQMDEYFQNGEPTGARLFHGYPESLDNVIVKFGKREHLEAMRTDGSVRVTPASFYSQGSLLKAMQDLETEREFHISALEAVLLGRTYATTKSGYRGKVEDGFVKQPVRCPNYVLWCACRDIDRRMPDDFGANAALIVRRPDVFAKLFEKEIKKLWPGTKTSSGPVQYYDPCSFIHRNPKPVRLKHFSFAYQREWRFCAFPPARHMPVDPVVINLGDLSDISKLVVLPS